MVTAGVNPAAATAVALADAALAAAALAALAALAAFVAAAAVAIAACAAALVTPQAQRNRHLELHPQRTLPRLQLRRWQPKQLLPLSVRGL